MRRRALGVLVSTMLLFAASGTSVDAKEPIRLGIWPFTESGSGVEGAGNAAADVVAKAILELNRFEIVERSQLDKVIPRLLPGKPPDAAPA